MKLAQRIKHMEETMEFLVHRRSFALLAGDLETVDLSRTTMCTQFLNMEQFQGKQQ